MMVTPNGRCWLVRPEEAKPFGELESGLIINFQLSLHSGHNRTHCMLCSQLCESQHQQYCNDHTYHQAITSTRGLGHPCGASISILEHCGSLTQPLPLYIPPSPPPQARDPPKSRVSLRSRRHSQASISDFTGCCHV